MKEYRKIPSLKFLYEVNQDGIIRNVKSKKILSQSVLGEYMAIACPRQFTDYGTSRILVHRLVAECWLNKNNFKHMPDEDLTNINLDSLVINHKDENKLNNNYKNLEWCTTKYNINYGTAIQRRSEKRTGVPIDKSFTYNIKMDGKNIGTIYDAIEIVKSEGYATGSDNTIQRQIYRATTGKRKIAYKHKWERITTSNDYPEKE